MFASMTFSMTEQLRRAGAYLKAFALLEDPPSAPLAPRGETGSQRTASLGSRATTTRAATRLPAGVCASHAHRGPPPTSVAPTRRRRPGVPPSRPQICLTPIAAAAAAAGAQHTPSCRQASPRA
jgi:hypothetical protein